MYPCNKRGRNGLSVDPPTYLSSMGDLNCAESQQASLSKCCRGGANLSWNGYSRRAVGQTRSISSERAGSLCRRPTCANSRASSLGLCRDQREHARKQASKLGEVLLQQVRGGARLDRQKVLSAVWDAGPARFNAYP